MTDWLEALNPPRRAAMWELASTGRMTHEIIDAVRDEHFEHAAGLVLAGAAANRDSASRIARAISTGEQQ